MAETVSVKPVQETTAEETTEEQTEETEEETQETEEETFQVVEENVVEDFLRMKFLRRMKKHWNFQQENLHQNLFHMMVKEGDNMLWR